MLGVRHRETGWRNKKTLGRVFVTDARERAEVTREWRRLYNKDLLDLLLLLLLLISLVITIIIIIIIIVSYYYYHHHH
jgi:hypothetical protein